MISAARQVLGSKRSVPDALASSPAQECFARNLYRDRDHDIDAAKLLPGEYFVSTNDMLLVTVLGSCVAACIRDVRMGIGGMNHFMLPDGDASNPDAIGARYGTYAMDVLISHLLKLGARRENLWDTKTRSLLSHFWVRRISVLPHGIWRWAIRAKCIFFRRAAVCWSSGCAVCITIP
jgi:hypothetical protein